jgi:predicted amidophosphoribosyltransferase
MPLIPKTFLLISKELLHLVFPPTADEKIISKLDAQHFKDKLNVQNIKGIQALSTFKDPEVRAALHLTKFHGNSRATLFAATILHSWVTLKLPQAQEYVLIPLPLSDRRYRERGYNQTERIAKKATESMCDVVTTGATMRAAKAALLQHASSPITCVVLAH